MDLNKGDNDLIQVENFTLSFFWELIFFIIIPILFFNDSNSFLMIVFFNDSTFF